MKLFMGLMSGTSMDGIDAALVDMTSNTFVHGITCPYSRDAKDMLLEALLTNVNSLGYYSQLNTLLGRDFAQTVRSLLKNSGISAKNIIAVGSHGQTLCHDTTQAIPYTVQLGCPHTIAEQTGITVVADFRTRDLIVGGQGAPFAPIYHQAIFKKQGFPLAVVNIGGIANLTYLSNDKDVNGYDLGPGNCLMDAWIFKHHNRAYDSNGEWASAGQVINPLLEALLKDAYFKRDYPKSIGKEYFSLDWLTNYLSKDYPAVDVQATLLHLTAISIADSIKTQTIVPEHLLICGGGAHNSALLKALSRLLPDVIVQSTAAFNINPDFVEAMMFAWLADKTLSRSPLDLNQITGAKNPTILGAIYPAGIDKGISLEV